ncbi:G-type lectin S-receptor-like serine/threonine-protein kinase RLK1 [Humulus lupulus]|uniref:G-type lectin S-receptor-like serine/threonine-protein kinase RLK1 n=1 Tax=Humulus lupulus TaxID=3486 RepID=UPI002B4028EC|nr:G-type lectin S-receptor-like serine/threonine-protein kinase RLK1 [Humulus lupulus]XP_062083412.1 G-type lectin S-receptor-like serine/threonine-protein kinase RLK1 [Humulus lupulus]
MTVSSQLVFLLIPLLFFLSTNYVFAQTNKGKVNLGTSLFAEENSSPWLSQNGDFAFGFRQLRNQDDDILFLLCIWYANIPNKTIVWHANGETDPVMVPRGSQLNLSANHGLLLTMIGGTCWKKRFPLSNGRVDNTNPSIAFIKIRKGILSGSVCVNFMLLGAICVGILLARKKKSERSPSPQDDPESNLRCYSYKELEEATDDFKDELGHGSFGIVYKGHLIQTNASIVVAVKKLSSILKDGEREFKAELKSIGQIHHKNLARLLGYCNDGPNRLLVYEYLSNNTLASFLFGGIIRPCWNQRSELALGIAKGLLYLHEECNTQIIHCYIKPQNILLDEYNNAKISDFGLAKLLMINQSHTHTAIRGTKGYVAPEWFRKEYNNVYVFSSS